MSFFRQMAFHFSDVYCESSPQEEPLW